eukprot:TRINITY_DN615_c0_g2_i4.p1 TRINITY_DN615_c0_g2~~TRINITY_DN615_c0_g2_i4.p1  ORF type:complete len:294 (+),score=50.09 TRINITY_DN615_c0_g2_i4:72-953(+)
MRAWGEQRDESSRGTDHNMARSRTPPRRRGGGDSHGSRESRRGVTPSAPPPVVHLAAGNAGAPPPYDGAGKGAWSSWEMYFGKGTSGGPPPAYDGAGRPGAAGGHDPYHYVAANAPAQFPWGVPPGAPPMMPPPFYGAPPLPPWMLGGKGFGSAAVLTPAAGAVGSEGGKGKGKDKDRGGKDRRRRNGGGSNANGGGGNDYDWSDKAPPSVEVLDSQLESYFSDKRKGPPGNSADSPAAAHKVVDSRPAYSKGSDSKGKGSKGANGKMSPSAQSLDEELAAYMARSEAPKTAA